MNDALLDAALTRFESGIPVLAVRDDKSPYASGWDRWFREPQTESEVRQLFSNGATGIGLLLYPASALIVFDFDGEHAREAWKQNAKIALPDTTIHRTPSGGFHLLYRVPEGAELSLRRRVRFVKANCACPKGCGVDVLVNGFAICPPTPGYHEDADHPFEELAYLNDEMLKLIQDRAESRSGRGAESAGRGRIRDGERNASLTSIAGAMRRRGVGFESILETLIRENAARCQPPLDEREVEAIARSVSRYAPQPDSEEFRATDLWNAERFARDHRDEARWSAQKGWLLWAGSHWRSDDTGAVLKLAGDTVRGIYAMAAVIEDPDTRQEIAQHARRSESRSRLEAMIVLAQPDLAISTAELDTDPMLLNAVNGTINLRTGELQQHRRDHFITRCLPIAYDPAAECPEWQKFLGRVTCEDAELAGFLQRAVGYALTGATSEQCLFVLFGCGSNGKSTLVRTLLALLDGYACSTRTETLLTKRNDTINNDVARLAGIRFVSAVETDPGKRLAEGLVKQLTGGDRVTARYLHKEFFEFEPVFKLFLAVNHRPVVRDTSHAMWRRIRLLPFNAVISDEEKDPEIDTKLRGELPGILAWAVRGCLEWQRAGLGAPEIVRAATAKYRAESDVVGLFIAERCRLGADLTITKGRLYETYKGWTVEVTEHTMSKKLFGMVLLERGFKDARDGERNFWIGIDEAI